MNAPAASQPRLPDGAQARVRILEASVELFARHGFEGASTTRIAAAADISQSVVLYHFGSKEALWRAAMIHLFNRVSAVGSVSNADTKDLDPLSRLKVALRRFIRLSARHPELGRIIMREGAEGGERLDWLVENALSVNYAVYTRLITDAQEAGQLRPHPAFHLTILLHAAASMLFNLQPLVEAMDGRPLQENGIDRLIDMIVETVFTGITVREDVQT
jgi:AcrR family transcriptional regulator